MRFIRRIDFTRHGALQMRHKGGALFSQVQIVNHDGEIHWIYMNSVHIIDVPRPFVNRISLRKDT